MAEFREEARRREDRPGSRAGMIAIVVVWILCAALLAWFFWPRSR
jgi:hypothetical protein